MPKIMLWMPEMLKRAGSQINQDLVRAYHEYCTTGQRNVPVNLNTAAAFTGLVLANMNIDPAKRDLFLQILRDPLVDPLAYQKLHILKWTPVQKMLTAYARIATNDLAPSLPRLIEMQKERHKDYSPTWSSIMPDKIYAMSAFQGYPPNSFDDLLLPFGGPTLTAFQLYTGASIKGQPKLVHYEQLRKFCATWAHITGTPDATSLEINSGLHCFGEL